MVSLIIMKDWLRRKEIAIEETLQWFIQSIIPIQQKFNQYLLFSSNFSGS